MNLFVYKMLAHEPQVLKQGMVLLKESLDKLQPSVYNPSENTDLSICHEVVSASKPDKAMHSPQQTPVLHAVSAVHAYITMFLYVCRSGQVRKVKMVELFVCLPLLLLFIDDSIR